MTDAAEIRRAAIGLLARREHARLELSHKLRARGFEPEAVEATLDELEAERLLSDVRFAESYVTARVARGYGPQRIRAELRERGVGEEAIERELRSRPEDWFALACSARNKRFGGALPKDLKERVRQARFLQYRGFDTDQTRFALEEGGWE